MIVYNFHYENGVAQRFQGSLPLEPSLKRCTKCHKVHAISSYAAKQNNKRASWCKKCYAAYAIARRKNNPELFKQQRKESYYKNKEVELNRNKLWRQNNKERVKKVIRNRRIKKKKQVQAYLMNKSCMDCGERDSRLLEFDHRHGTKHKEISDMLSCSWEKILTEINKCDVVCGNCHAKRTARDTNNYKHRFHINNEIPSEINKTWGWQQKTYIINYLLEHPCLDCGEHDVRVLEFDHRDDAHKEAAVGNLVKAAIRRLIAEIEKCDVRCSNCHHLKHWFDGSNSRNSY